MKNEERRMKNEEWKMNNVEWEIKNIWKVINFKQSLKDFNLSATPWF